SIQAAFWGHHCGRAGVPAVDRPGIDAGIGRITASRRTEFIADHAGASAQVGWSSQDCRALLPPASTHVRLASSHNDSGEHLMQWIFLSTAIISEVIATSALKASEGFTRFWPSLIVVAGYAIAFYFLSLTLRTIPV